MTKYEHRIETFLHTKAQHRSMQEWEKWMDTLGDQGWQLVQWDVEEVMEKDMLYDCHVFLFKRKIEK